MKKLYTLALSVALVGMVAGNAFAQNTNSGNGDQTVTSTSTSSLLDVNAALDFDQIGSDNDGNNGSAVNSFNAFDSGNFDYSETNTATVEASSFDNSGVNQGLDNGSSIENQTNDLSTGDRYSLTSTVDGSFNTNVDVANTSNWTYSDNGNTTFNSTWADSSVDTTTTTFTTDINTTYTDNVIGNGNASFDTVGVGINGLGAGSFLGDAGANINNNQTYVMTGDNVNLNNINQPAEAP